MDIQLRDYQKNGANELYTKLKTNDSVLFQLATGGGKTFIFSFFIKYWIGANDKNVLILVHRSELVALIEGDTAVGGGEYTVVLESILESTVLLLVDSVTIGSAKAVVPIINKINNIT